jgi:hypothetical protein
LRRKGWGSLLYLYIILIAAWTLAGEKTFYCAPSFRYLCLLSWKTFSELLPSFLFCSHKVLVLLRCCWACLPGIHCTESPHPTPPPLTQFSAHDAHNTVKESNFCKTIFEARKHSGQWSALWRSCRN